MKKSLSILIIICAVCCLFVSCEEEHSHTHAYFMDDKGVIKCTGCQEELTGNVVSLAEKNGNGWLLKDPKPLTQAFESDATGPFVIRSEEGSNIEVNTPNADVHFYGKAESIDIEAVKSESAHIFAEVENVAIEKGHLVAEKDCQIKTINVSKNEAKITLAKSSAVNNVNLPSDYTGKIVAEDAGKCAMPSVKKGESTASLSEIIDNKSAGDIPANPSIAKIGDAFYESLEAAITTATSGDTIKLLKDIECTCTLTKDGFQFTFNGVNLDLNKHTIKITKASGGGCISVSGGDVTISNGSVETSVKSEGSSSIKVLQGANLTLEDVNIKSYVTGNESLLAYGPVAYGSYMDNPNGNLTINGGTYDCIVGTNGSTRGGSLTINDGTFDYLYLPAYMDYTINGGTFNKMVEVRSGKLTVNGGAFNYEGEPSIEWDGDDPGIDGCSIALVSHNGLIEKEGYGPNPAITITGGTFAGNICLVRVKGSYEYPKVTNKNNVSVVTKELGRESTE